MMYHCPFGKERLNIFNSLNLPSSVFVPYDQLLSGQKKTAANKRVYDAHILLVKA